MLRYKIQINQLRGKGKETGIPFSRFELLGGGSICKFSKIFFIHSTALKVCGSIKTTRTGCTDENKKLHHTVYLTVVLKNGIMSCRLS